MKIKRLEVEGYKSLKHVVWEPGNLNVFLGPNGGGKSNLVRLLELVSASAKGELEEFINNDGGIGAILWDGSAPSITVNLDTCPSAESEVESCPDLRYELVLDHSERWNRYQIERECLQNLNEEKEPSPVEKSDKKETEEDQSERKAPAIILKEADNASLRRPDGGPLIISRSKDNETLLGEFTDLTSADPIIEVYGKYLTGFRFHYDPDTGYSSPVRSPSITRYDNRLNSDGSNLVNFLHTLYTENHEFRSEVNSSMRAAFGPEYEELIFTPAADQFIQLRIRWKSLKWQQPSSALSVGILKYLYLITILANPDPPPLVVIDGLETGLNPVVFPVISELAASMAEKTQVIITTHSPEFLNSFENVTPTTTIFGIAEGETELNTISDAELKRWLKVYRLGDKYRNGELESNGPGR